MNTDLIIDVAVTAAELATTPFAWAAAGADQRTVTVLGGITNGTARPPTWSEAEDHFLTENLGRMHEAEIAAALGRSRQAVHLRWRRAALPAPTQDQRYVTARGAARILGVDVHAALRLIHQNILPARLVPCDAIIWRIQRTELWRWATNPYNWIYFRPDRVIDPDLKQLIRHRQKHWPDAWLTVKEAATYLQLSARWIRRLICAGKLPAKRYGKYWLLRSDVEQVGRRRVHE